MTFNDILQALTLLVVVFTGVFMPILWRCYNQQNSDRATTRAELEKHLVHIDGCIDDLKKEVANLRTDMACVRNDRGDK